MAEQQTTVEAPVEEKPVTEKPTKVKKGVGLRIVLWLSGLVFLFFGGWAFLPKETIEGFFGYYGRLIGEEHAFSGGPLEAYILRVTLMSFLVFGVFLIVAAADPMRFRALVALAIVMSAMFTVFAPIVGEMSGISYRWYMLDAGPALLMLVLLLVFWKQTRPAT